MAAKITIRPNGPYLVEGDVEVVDVNGNKIDTSGRGPRFALCRCGGSVTKPFCGRPGKEVERKRGQARGAWPLPALREPYQRRPPAARMPPPRPPPLPAGDDLAFSTCSRRPS